MAVTHVTTGGVILLAHHVAPLLRLPSTSRSPCGDDHHNRFCLRDRQTKRRNLPERTGWRRMSDDEEGQGNLGASVGLCPVLEVMHLAWSKNTDAGLAEARAKAAAWDWPQLVTPTCPTTTSTTHVVVLFWRRAECRGQVRCVSKQRAPLPSSLL